MCSSDADKEKYNDIIERLETLEYFALNIRRCVNATIGEIYTLDDALIEYARELKTQKANVPNIEKKIAQHIMECSDCISRIAHRIVALRDNTRYLQIKKKMQ